MVMGMGTFEGRLAGGDLPEDYAVAEYVCFLGVFLAGDHLGGHPLVCADLASHVVLQSFRPAEVRQFDFVAVIEEQVQAFQISVDDGWRASVQVVHASGCVQSEFPSVFP